MSVTIAPDALVSGSASLGEGTTVWHLAEVREGARVGARCILGRGAYIDAGVVLGDDCKVQNQALVYAPAVIGDGVFVGPAACLTNDRHPRAVTPEGVRKSAADWEPVGVTCGDGASIGAAAVCVAPVAVGRWALVAAGAVVVRDVPDFALVAGNPARQIGWVGRAGARLRAGAGPGEWTCPVTGAGYREVEGRLLEDSS